MNILNKIDWKKILEPDEFIFKDKSKKVKLQRIKWALKDLSCSRPNIDINMSLETDFLFLKSMKREDYDWLFYEIIDTCKSDRKKIIDIEYINSGEKKFYRLKLFFRYFTLYRKAIRSSFLDTIFLIIKMIHYLKVYDRIRHFSYQKLVVFADMQPIDNMLVQIAKKKDVLTVTMQHGLYIDYEDYSTVNATNYSSAVADIFLAWGNDTAELINKYHPDIITKIVGKPFEANKVEKKENYFTVVFDSNYFFEHNIELLKIAYEICDTLNLKVNLRLHPNNQLQWFKINKNTTCVDENIMFSKFILGHTTTMLYECMISGIPSFRYKTDKPSNKILNELEFRDTKELISILNNQNIIDLNFNKVSQNYFKYISVESKKKYTDFFSKLPQGVVK